jgi:hypothetical protein
MILIRPFTKFPHAKVRLFLGLRKEVQLPCPNRSAKISDLCSFNAASADHICVKARHVVDIANICVRMRLARAQCGGDG